MVEVVKTAGARRVAVDPDRPLNTLPRRYHHTWRHTHLHPLLRRCVDSFSKWNADWEACFWTDDACEALIREELPDFLPTYLAYPPGILRADIFRVVVLYLRGGVYADLDMECLRPLDELVQQVTQGDDAWEVLLARDHPCHERAHYQGRPMWLNAFMIAKPKARLWSLVLDAFTRQLQSGYDGSDAVQATGPGLLTKIVELGRSDLQALGIQEMHWRWVHPLPNVLVHYAERKAYKSLIRSRQWREGLQVQLVEDDVDFQPRGEPPFVAHYWWHSYLDNCRLVNMLVMYGQTLLQSDGEIVERRLGTCSLAECPESLGEALCQMAERGGRHILVKGEPLPGHMLEAVRQSGTGLNWIIMDELSMRGSGEPVDLVIENVSTAQAAGSGRVNADSLSTHGLHLILLAGRDCAQNSVPPPDGTRCISEYSLWERTPGAEEEIPPVFHLFENKAQNIWQQAAARSWKAAHPAGWQIRVWSQTALEDFVRERQPDFLATFHDYPSAEHRARAGRLVVLKHLGGVAVSSNLVCLRNLTGMLRRKKLMLATSAGVPKANDEWLACSAGHPFWKGLVSHLESTRFRSLDEAVGTSFLNERCHAARCFLDREEWPELQTHHCIGAHPEGTEWLRLVRAHQWSALALLKPNAAVLSMRASFEKCCMTT